MGSDSHNRAFSPSEATRLQVNSPAPTGSTPESAAGFELFNGNNSLSTSGGPPRTTGKRLLIIGGTSSWFRDFEHRLLEVRPVWFARHAADLLQGQSLLDSERWDGMIFPAQIANAEASRVQKRFPRVFCITLSSGANRTKAPEGQHADDCATDGSHALEAAESVVRSFSVQDWTAQLPLCALLARIKHLPTLPRLHTQVTKELQSPNGSLEVVAQFIRQDPIMAAKFLQVANSAFFGLSYTVTDPAEAVMFLGVVRTRALILMAGVFSQFDDLACPGFSAEQVWNHSLKAASIAQGIALMQLEDPKLAEMAFTAGLLHDIGKLVLASNVPEMYATAHKLQQIKRIGEADAELTILNTTHAELGACLLGTWCLPLPIVEAVAWHHSPSRSYDTQFSVLTAVHAANAFAHEATGANTGIGKPSGLDLMYLVRLGIAERRHSWREACGVPMREEEGTFQDQVRRRSESKRN